MIKIFSLLSTAILLGLLITSCSPAPTVTVTAALSTTGVSISSPIINNNANNNNPDLEKYLVKDDGYTKQYQYLKTVGEWSGTGDKQITFRTDKSPWVINYDFQITSNIESQISVVAATKSGYNEHSGYYSLADIMMGQWIWGSTGGVTPFIVVPQNGDFIISVRSSGCSWTLKAAVEN